MAGSYWDKFTAQRVTRRRVLQSAGVAGAAAGAVWIVGCGGGSSRSSGRLHGLGRRSGFGCFLAAAGERKRGQDGDEKCAIHVFPLVGVIETDVLSTRQGL